VATHARSLLTSTPEGATDYLEADLREPAAIVRAAARTLDFRRPVGIVLMAELARRCQHSRDHVGRHRPQTMMDDLT
jgi:hypothetical protein